MRQIICDRCKKIIAAGSKNMDRRGYFEPGQAQEGVIEIVFNRGNEPSIVELCVDCYRQVLEFCGESTAADEKEKIP